MPRSVTRRRAGQVIASVTAAIAAGTAITVGVISYGPNNPDTSPPVVRLTAPSKGATLTGTVTLSATCKDNVGCTGVQFKLNGSNVGSEDTTSPFSVSFDTTTITNSTYVLSAVARDAANNTTATTLTRSVLISNTAVIPKHVETWAYDDYNQGTTATSAMVGTWVSYAESLGGTKALTDCSGLGGCDAVAYFDPNRIYSCSGCSIPIASAASENWWLHQPGFTDSAHRLTATDNGTDYAFFLNQSVQAVRDWLAQYVKDNLNSYDALMVDDTAAGTANAFFGTGFTSSNEITTDAQVVSMHQQLAAQLKHVDGTPFRQIDNSFTANAFLPHGFNLIDVPNGVESLLGEQVPLNGGTVTSYYSTLLDSLAYVNQNTAGKMVLLSTATAAPAAARRLHTATVLLGYEPGRVISWEDLDSDGTSMPLQVYPEAGLYPTQPVQTMAAPTGTGCLDGSSGTVCTSGGHNTIQVATGVYRREFGQCYNQGTSIGRCAVIVNVSGSSVTFNQAWLQNTYANQMVMTGGTVQSGGTISFSASTPTTIPTSDALILSDPGVVGAGTANLWVDPTGGTCTRQATAGAYNDAAACSSLGAAYTAASNQDTVIVKDGSYTASFTGSKASPSYTNQITFKAENADVPIITSLSFASTADNILLKDFSINTTVFSGGDVRPSFVTFKSNNIMVAQKLSGGQVFNLHEVQNWTFDGNTFGPACCNATAPNSPEFIRLGAAPASMPAEGDCSDESCNIVIKNNLFQFIQRSCSFWPTSGFGSCPDATCTDTGLCHLDAIHIFGAQNVDVLYNRFYGDGCQEFFVEGSGSGQPVANYNYNIIGNAFAAANEGCGDEAIDIGTSGGNTWNNMGGDWVIAFNSMDGSDHGSGHGTVINLGNGSVAGALAGTTLKIVGNIGQMNCPSAGSVTVTYAYNLFSNGTCGGTDTQSTPTFVSWAFAPAVGQNMHLNTTSTADNFVPTSYCTANPGICPTVDIDGTTRPAGAAYDAGADER